MTAEELRAIMERHAAVPDLDVWPESVKWTEDQAAGHFDRGALLDLLDLLRAVAKRPDLDGNGVCTFCDVPIELPGLDHAPDCPVPLLAALRPEPT